MKLVFGNMASPVSEILNEILHELIKYILDLAGTIDVGVADPEVLGVVSACSDQDIVIFTRVPGHCI